MFKKTRGALGAIFCIVIILTVVVGILIYLFPGADYCVDKLKRQGSGCIGACYVTAVAHTGGRTRTVRLSDKYVSALFNSCMSREYKWDDNIFLRYGQGDGESVDIWLNNGRMFSAIVSYQPVNKAITVQVYGEVDLPGSEHWITTQIDDAGQIKSVETVFNVLSSIRIDGADPSLADCLATNK